MAKSAEQRGVVPAGSAREKLSETKGFRRALAKVDARIARERLRPIAAAMAAHRAEAAKVRPRIAAEMERVRRAIEAETEEKKKIDLVYEMEHLEQEEQSLDEYGPLFDADVQAWGIKGHDLVIEAAVIRAGRAIKAEIEELSKKAIPVPKEMEEAIKTLRGYQFASGKFLLARPPGTKTNGRPVSKAEAVNAVIAELCNIGQPHSVTEISQVLSGRYEIDMSPKDVSRAIDNIKKQDARRASGKRWLKPAKKSGAR